jgi:hypothetical protein
MKMEAMLLRNFALFPFLLPTSCCFLLGLLFDPEYGGWYSSETSGLSELHGVKTHMNEVFKYRVLRRIFGPKRKERRGGWRKLHNKELHNL